MVVGLQEVSSVQDLLEFSRQARHWWKRMPGLANDSDFGLGSWVEQELNFRSVVAITLPAAKVVDVFPEHRHCPHPDANEIVDWAV